MTQGLNIGTVLIKSMALSVLATFFTIPYFNYLIFEIPSKRPLPEGLASLDILFTQLFLLFLICFLAALIGFTFCRRVGLPGFGDMNDLIRSIPFLLIIGFIMTAISYFFFDRHFIKLSPVSYPNHMLYLASYPLKGAFTEELILRFCMVTLGVGIFRSKMVGVVLISAVASGFTVKYLQFVGFGFHMNYLFIMQLLLSFSANLLLGYLYVTRGLLHAMALKFLFGMKYAIIGLAMG